MNIFAERFIKSRQLLANLLAALNCNDQPTAREASAELAKWLNDYKNDLPPVKYDRDTNSFVVENVEEAGDQC